MAFLYGYLSIFYLHERWYRENDKLFKKIHSDAKNLLPHFARSQPQVQYITIHNEYYMYETPFNI